VTAATLDVIVRHFPLEQQLAKIAIHRDKEIIHTTVNGN